MTVFDADNIIPKISASGRSASHPPSPYCFHPLFSGPAWVSAPIPYGGSVTTASTLPIIGNTSRQSPKYKTASPIISFLMLLSPCRFLLYPACVRGFLFNSSERNIFAQVNATARFRWRLLCTMLWFLLLRCSRNITDIIPTTKHLHLIGHNLSRVTICTCRFILPLSRFQLAFDVN